MREAKLKHFARLKLGRRRFGGARLSALSLSCVNTKFKEAPTQREIHREAQRLII